jgi:hypothetical protein
MKSIWNDRSILGANLALLAATLVGCSGALLDPSSDLESTVSGAASPQRSSAEVQDADTTDGSQAIPAGARFVFIQREANGAYAIDELNASGGTQNVAALDLGAARCDLHELTAALTTPRTVAALGAIEGDTFVAVSVYRALPGAAPAAGDSFYQAQLRRGGDVATSVNIGEATDIAQVDVSNVKVPFVDETWLFARVLEAGAIAAGSLSAKSAALVVSTVYLPVPDDATCAVPVDTCGEGTVAMYARDPSRCLQLTGCTPRGMCPQFIPVCEPGYELSRWSSTPDGCAASACDPIFDPAPTQ